MKSFIRKAVTVGAAAILASSVLLGTGASSVVRADGYWVVGDDGEWYWVEESAFVPDTTGVGGFVARLYSVVLGREPDRYGYNYWCDTLRSGGVTGREVAEGFFTSDEFKNMHLNNRQYVDVLYNVFFDRDADSEGSTYWREQLSSGMKRRDIRNGFYDSTEWANTCVTFGIRSGGSGRPNVTPQPSEDMLNFVRRLYWYCLGREADQDGLNSWANKLYLQEMSAKQVALGFFYSQEFLARANSMSAHDMVCTFYRVFLDREPDEYDLDYWKVIMELGDSISVLFTGVADSDEFVSLCAGYGVIPGDHIELQSGLSGDPEFISYITSWWSYDAIYAINLLNSVPLSTRTNYIEYTYLTDHYTARLCSISDRDIQVLEQFAAEHFEAGWTPGMKVVYTAWWITQHSDYAVGSDWNIIGSRGYADAIINCHLGQCAQYNGCLLEMMAWLGYDVSMMFVPGNQTGGWQHYWCDVNINGTLYFMDAGNESHSYPAVCIDYRESSRGQYRPGVGLPM